MKHAEPATFAVQEGAMPRADKATVRRRHVASEFFDYTSAHGLASVKRNTGWVRYVWVAVVLVLWIIMVYQVSMVFATYFAYPINVGIRIRHAKEMEFPAVSICNLNAIRRDKLEGLGGEEAKALLEMANAPETNNATWAQKAARRQELLDRRVKLVFKQNINFFQPYWTYALNWSLADIGHQLEDMMLECSYQGLPCLPSDFHRWQDPRFGNCFTFFHLRHQRPTHSGPSNGLEVALVTESEVYLPMASPSAGFRVFVGAEWDMPFPESKGFSLPPGFATSVAVRESRVHRLPLPFDGVDCRPTDTRLGLQDEWARVRTEAKAAEDRGCEEGLVHYSAYACVRQCLVTRVAQDCACVEAQVVTRRMATDIDPSFAALPPCDLDNKTVHRCIWKLGSERRRNKECKERCPMPCDEKLYDTRVTNSVWPTAEAFALHKDSWAAHVNKSTGLDTVNNVARLQVYFQDLTYEEITEEEAMNLWSLFSNFGGTLGLFGGLSFLTLFEVVELCFRCAGRSSVEQ